MESKLITLPTTTPISMQEAKDHLYLTSDTYNDELARKLDEAVDYCQRRIVGRRQFCQATYDLILNGFPDDGNDDRIEIPYPPLQNVQWIKYYNSTGGLTTYGSTLGSTASSTSWTQVVTGERPGYVTPAYALSWPTARDVPNAVTVRYVAGSTTPTTIPGTLKAAVKLKLEHLWDPERIDEQKQEAAIDSLLGGNDYGYYQ